MKIKTSELKDTVLDYATAVVLGGTKFRYDTIATYWITVDGKDLALSRGWAQSFTPSTDWIHGGPIIERQEIELHKWAIDGWKAVDTNYQFLNTSEERPVFTEGYGPTPLIAAMRVFVASRLGNEVDVPDELK